MSYQFQKVSIRDLARGLDLRSAENAVKEGFAEVLKNADTSSSGHVSKRQGYQRYYGNVPMRVTGISHSGTKITFSLDGSIDTTALTTTPLVVQGKLGNPDNTPIGDWDLTDNAEYYPSFTTSIPDTFQAGTSTFAFDESRHGVNTSDAFINAFESTTPDVNNDTEFFIPGRTDIETIDPFDIEFETTLAAAQRTFVIAEDKSTVGGDSYVQTDILPPVFVASSDGSTTITKTTHNLQQDDIIKFNPASLPSPLAHSTDYYADVLDGNTFRLSLTPWSGTPTAIAVTAGSPSLKSIKRSFTIPAATHQLVIFNIGAQFYVLDSTEYVQMYPDNFTVDENTGECVVTYEHTGTTTYTAKTILSAAPITNKQTDAVAASIDITGQEDDFYFLTSYNKPVGGLSTLIIPDRIRKFDLTDKFTIDYATSLTGEFVNVWEFTELTSNAIVVEDNSATSTSYVDTEPQMTMWGLDHEGAYDANTQGGHVTHIDSYRREAEQRLVTGLGGNLFTARSRAEISATHLVPQFEANIDGRTDEDRDISPVFGWERTFLSTDVDTTADTITIPSHTLQNDQEIIFQTTPPTPLVAGTVYKVKNITNDTFQVADTDDNLIDLTAQSGDTVRRNYERTRAESGAGLSDGNIFSTSVDSTGNAKITAVEFVSAGVAKYTLTLTGKSRTLDDTGSLGGPLSATTVDIISTDSAAPDFLTVSGMAHDVHNGTFTITAVDEANNQITVTNDSLLVNDFDETGACGRGGIFTDQIVLQADSTFLPDDEVDSPVFTNINPVAIVSTTTDKRVVMKLVTDFVNIPGGLKVFGSRTTDTVPVNSTDNIVAGDVCAVTDLTREVRIKSINANSDVTISTITGDGTSATVTTTAPHLLDVGKKVLILRSGVIDYDGEQVITGLVSSTSFTFASTDTTGSATGVVQGKTVELDETLDIVDEGANPTQFTVSGRWVPVEAPTTSDTLPQSTYRQHLDANAYQEQSILRSTMAADNMYFTNGDDEVYKFDGNDLYRAGLFRWQPQLFASVRTTASGADPALVEAPKVRYSKRLADSSEFEMIDDITGLTAGQRIVDDATSTVYTVSEVNTLDNLIKVDDPTSALVSTEHTFTVAASGSNAEFTATNHGFSVFDKIRFSSTGELPRVKFDAKVKVDPINILTMSTNTVYDLPTGTAIQVSPNSTFKPISTDDKGINYYLIRLEDEIGTGTSTFKLASSLDNANNGVSLALDLSDGQDVDFTVQLRTGVDYTVASVPGPNTFFIGTARNTFTYEFEDGGSGTHTVTKQTTAADAIRAVRTFKYYFRLNAIDTNRNIIASAATGSEDFVIDLSDIGEINLRVLGFPAWENYDFDTLELQVYRTTSNTEAPFYLVKNLDIDFNETDGYIDIVDDVEDSFLREFDSVNTSLKGAELGTAWTSPPRAKYITSLDNRLVLANLRDYPELDIVLRPNNTGSFNVNTLVGDRLFFKRDSLDTNTDTNMIDRVGYEFVSGGVSFDPTTDLSIDDATTFTITSTSHGLVAGDWVYLHHFNIGPSDINAILDNRLEFAGWFQINSATINTFSIKSTHNRTVGVGTAYDVRAFVAASNSGASRPIGSTSSDVPVLITASDYNYSQVGTNVNDEFEIITRFASAINASMRVLDFTQFSGFEPWITANAGTEIGIGRLLVRQDKVQARTISVKVPTTASNGQWFIHSILRSLGEEVTAQTKLFPSRVVISYPNFPELFDNPYGNQDLSDSIIDVNSADGQEITGIIPFFGSSVFGAGQVEQHLVVFKTNSIYLIDVATRQLNRIQSRGLGCTAPFSITQTRDGIMFANESGIYRLNRDQSISYVGKLVERAWQDRVNRDSLSQATGHNYANREKYKLSIPIDTTASSNTGVLVYDYQREGQDQEFGAWSEYDNHDATGWTNQGTESYWASTVGRIYKVRDEVDATDYRDDDQAISMEVVFGATDFGQPGTRKIVGSVTTHFQLRRSGHAGTEMLSSADLDGIFSSAGTFTLVKDETVKVETVRSALPRRRQTYIQLKYTNATKDEDVVIGGIDYNVTLLTEKGIRESSESG